MLKNAVLNSLDRVVMVAARLASAVVIARLLGPKGYGVFQLALTLSVIAAALADFGFGIANNYLASRYPLLRAKLLGNSLIFAGGVGTISALLTSVVLLTFRASTFPEMPETYLWWIPLSVPIQAIQISLIGLTYGANKFKEKVIGTFLHYGLFLLVIAVLAAWGYLSTDSLVPLWIIGLSASSLYWVWVLFKDTTRVLTWDRVVIREQLQYGRNSYLYNVAHMVNFRLDLFLVAYFLEAEHIGWYALATSITEAFLYMPKALSSVVLTETAMGLQHGIKPVPHLVYKGTFLFTGTVVIGTAILAPFLIPLVFSASFIPSIAPLFLLLPGTLAMALGIIAAYHLFGLGKASQPSLAALLATVITIILDLLLIPVLGIQGAALASTLAYLIFFITCLSSVLVEIEATAKSLLIPTRHDMTLLVTTIKKVWPYGRQSAA